MTTRTELIEWLRKEVKDSTYPPTDEPEAMMIKAADMLKADGKEQRKPEWRRGFEAGLSANEKIAKDATNALRSEQQAHLETNRLMTQAITDSEATNDKLREAARLALDALINGRKVRNGEGGTEYQPPLEDAAITALKEVL